MDLMQALAGLLAEGMTPAQAASIPREWEPESCPIRYQSTGNILVLGDKFGGINLCFHLDGKISIQVSAEKTVQISEEPTPTDMAELADFRLLDQYPGVAPGSTIFSSEVLGVTLAFNRPQGRDSIDRVLIFYRSGERLLVEMIRSAFGRLVHKKPECFLPGTPDGQRGQVCEHHEHGDLDYIRSHQFAR